MSHHSRFRGAFSLRRALVAAALVAVSFGAADAQENYIKAERPKQDEFSEFVDFQKGGKLVVDTANKNTTERNRKLLDRISQWLVFQLTEPQHHTAQGTDGMSKLVRDASARMLLQPARSKQNAQQKQFVEEFGKVMVANLEKVLGNSKPIVRVNAARMLSEVARTGYEGAAEACLAVLAKPDESDGVKFWALHGLRNLFAIVEDPALNDQFVSIFARRDLQQADLNKNKDLERRCIIALCNYVTRKNEIAPDTPANQLEGLRYVRREAIRALGHVRMQTVRKLFNGPVDARPALVLLRVAGRDAPAPEPSISERIEAIIAFCQLYTPSERDLNVDYAVAQLGQALVEIGEFRLANMTNEDIPWKEKANDLQAALEGWQKHVEKMLLPEKDLVKGFVDTAITELLVPIQKGQEGLNPSPKNLRVWLSTRKPQSTTLFKNDPDSAVRPPATNAPAAATGGR